MHDFVSTRDRLSVEGYAEAAAAAGLLRFSHVAQSMTANQR